jgi:hypothetical protein
LKDEVVARIRNILLNFEYIRKENRHLNLNLIFIIVKYVLIYIISFKRSICWHNLFEGRSPIIFRGNHEKGMYYFFQVLLKKKLYLLFCWSKQVVPVSYYFNMIIGVT